LQSPFPYSDCNKRYHTLDYHLRHKFSSKVFKVSLNAGFTCPNRDGTKGVGGCTYCSAQGSGDFAGDPADSLIEQFEKIRDLQLKKWPNALYIPYFQAFTNTYASVAELKKRFEPMLKPDRAVGLSIATRADCLPDEVIEYLANLNQRTYLTVDLGLQTIHDKTAKRINRCHSYQEFLEGFQKLQAKGISTCVHIINGLPGETPEMMLETAKAVADLHPQSVKIHLLHVLKGTRLAEEFLAGEFEALTLPEYVQIVCDQLEWFPPETVIQRITGDGAKESLIAPLWSLKKFVVMNEIDKELARRDSYQGIARSGSDATEKQK